MSGGWDEVNRRQMQDLPPMPPEDDFRTAVMWLMERALGHTVPACNRCGHARNCHRIDDSIDVEDISAAPTRCIWPMPEGPAVQLCDCPNFVPWDENDV